MEFADLSGRSSLEWAVRVLIAAIICVVGYVAVLQSVAQSLQASEPETAHSLAPWNGRIKAEMVRSRFVDEATAFSNGQLAEQTRPQLDAIAELAHSAVEADATAIPAVTTLGFVAQLRGDKEAERRWFAYSEQLSRRDLNTQIWLIEDSVSRGGIPEALHHYDVALRTKTAAQDLLFPVLAVASAEPAVQQELVKVLLKRPNWTQDFIRFVARGDSDPSVAAHLFTKLSAVGISVPEDAQSILVDRLLNGGQLEAAWAYYAGVRPNADRRRSRDPEFNARLLRTSMLDWVTASSTTGLSATIQEDGRVGVFEFSAPPGLAGWLIRQSQLLPPGEYHLEGHSSGIEQPPRTRPYWRLTCRQGGRELGRVEVPNSSEKNGTFSGMLRVPTNCPVQDLFLVARASNALTGLTGQIDRVELSAAE